MPVNSMAVLPNGSPAKSVQILIVVLPAAWTNRNCPEAVNAALPTKAKA